MEYRPLGRTGVRVSAFCLGAMMFGPRGNADEDECVRMIRRALDAGVNFIDTADVYSDGVSEEIVGRGIKRRRDDVVLATKVHFPMGPGPNDRGNSRLWIMRAVEGSLRRLGTDHIDLYQLHRPDLETDLEESVEALSDLVHQGKVRYTGTSAFPAWMLVEAHWLSERRGLAKLACEQSPYSIFSREIERDLLPVAERYGMAVIVYSPLAGGWLTGKYRRDREPPQDSRMFRSREWQGRFADRFDLSRERVQRKLDLVEELVRVADGAGMPIAHLALAFILAHPGVTSAIIGPRTMEQLEELLERADLRLGEEALDEIDRLVPPGSLVDPADRAWNPPWLEPGARRRG
ncbi:MAG TPA: aldo/keto reductase [Actinomycetota bacterium]|nr:aldo/keto reductase [Actinomycetota bacterium]